MRITDNYKKVERAADDSWRGCCFRCSSTTSRAQQKREAWIFVVLCCGIFSVQLYYETVYSWSVAVPSDYSAIDVPLLEKGRTSSQRHREDGAAVAANKIMSNPHSNPRLRPMGACLMVKDDNDLLYEWLAYHFTTLVPPGHPFFVVLGSDIGSTQDPAQVLQLWNSIPELHYHILHSDDFVHVHGNYDVLYGRNKSIEEGSMSLDERKAFHHHALIHRQKGFVTACSQLLKQQGAAWTLYTDTDEFLALHPLSSDDEDLTIDGKGHYSITNASYQIRQRLSVRESMNEKKSVLQIIHELQDAGHNSTCYTIPRLLVGALENRTCPPEYGVENIRQLAQTQLQERYAYMSTLRFFQHAAKGNFARSKYGKVLMDLSRISDETIQTQKPRNIHRPYSAHCGPAGGAHFPNAVFFLMHYIGSWERYMARADERRNRREWEERAHVDETADQHVSAACSSFISFWFPRFMERVGQEPM